MERGRMIELEEARKKFEYERMLTQKVLENAIEELKKIKQECDDDHARYQEQFNEAVNS